MRGFKHKEFATFLRFARGSLGEVLNHLIDAYDQKLISADELDDASRIATTVDRRLHCLDAVLGVDARPATTPSSTKGTTRKHLAPTQAPRHFRHPGT